MMESNGLDEASLWINAVNDPCTIRKSDPIEELVGQTVAAPEGKEISCSDLSWANCGAKVEEFSGRSSYQGVSVLDDRVERPDIYESGDNDDDVLCLPDDVGCNEESKQGNEDFPDIGPNRDRFTPENCICKRQQARSLSGSHETQTESFTSESASTETGANRLNPKIRDCFVPCLNSINELRTRFGSDYELHLKLFTGKHKQKKTGLLTKYRFKKQLLVDLEEWESELNERSPDEPYIAVENKVDNARPPEDFVYVSHNIMPESVKHRFDKDYLVGCSCVRCTPLHCECPHNHGAKFAYDRSGQIQIEPGNPVYECNTQCSCSMTCRNRVVQRGRTVKVAIFRTSNGCGWGVKPMEPIQKNQFVTEYVGELITNEEAEERGKHYDAEGQTYLFDLDYNEGDCQFTLDAKKYGNISHFINHSCDPNLSVYGIWCDTLDPTLPRIALFASRDIAAGEELTFDYLMTADRSHKTKRIKCGCGSKDCRQYLY